MRFEYKIRKLGPQIESPIFVRAFDLPSAWYASVQAVLEKGVIQKVQAYDKDSKAVYNLVLHILHPETRPFANELSGCSDKMIMEYFAQYFWGAAKEGLEHVYGERLREPVNQFEEAARLLTECPWTRRAVMLIPRPEDLRSEYPPCIRELQFSRPAPDHNELWTTVFVRSWDVYSAGNPDLGSFQLAAEYVAKLVGISTGPMLVLATNAHIYRKSLDYLEAAERKTIPRALERMGVKIRSYRKGRAFEYYVKSKLEELGYYVRRQFMSRFPDLLVYGKGKFIGVVECKKSEKIRGEDFRRMVEYVQANGVPGIFAYKPEGKVAFWNIMTNVVVEKPELDFWKVNLG